MASRLPLTDKAGEVRELTEEDFAEFRPAAEVLPGSLRQKLGIDDTREVKDTERVTIQLSRAVVERFRATGAGWEKRMDRALQEWLQSHAP